MSITSYKPCAEFENQNRKTVTCTDKRSSTSYLYSNKSLDELSNFRVDRCLINDNQNKCDFLLLNFTKKKSFFIELKGSDLIKAVDQINRSIDILHADFPNFSVNARIVLTRVNTTDLKSIKLIKLEKRLQKLNGNLIKQSRILTEIN